MMKKNNEKECPYCKEEIKTEAVKCKHCHSQLSPEQPDHDGTCPFCKEDINLGVIKCKYCKSNLSDSTVVRDCGCNKPSDSNQEPIGSIAFRAGTGGLLRPVESFGLWDAPARRKCADCDLLLLSCSVAGLPGTECHKQWMFCKSNCW